MKRIQIILISLLYLFAINTISSFASIKNEPGTITIPVDLSTRTNCSFCPFRSENEIGGLSIDGHFLRIDDNFLVRVLLIDKQGKEHLIMELYKEICDTTSFDFSDYCEETVILDNVQPHKIELHVIGAELQLLGVNLAKKISNRKSRRTAVFEATEAAKRKHVQDVVNRINRYNETHNKIWRAGITPLSLKSYKEKKRILGFDDNSSTGAYEYYIDGIFEIGEPDGTNPSRSSSNIYVDEFDWRNRHGKNWITSVKNQQDMGYCCAFTAVGVTEAMMRLYYNQLIDIDLSEQEAACCNGRTRPWKGMTIEEPLNYIRDYGVCDEIAYPFVNDTMQADCHSNTVTPNELVSIGNYISVDTNEESLKQALITHGPLCSSVHYWGYEPDGVTKWYRNHAMPIVGFGILHEGDPTYQYILPDGTANGHIHPVQPGDIHIGMTYWIYKDSGGVDPTDPRQGYRCIIHHNYNKSMGNTYYISHSITSMHYSDNDIVCEDADGDGYYFWGIGQKPSFCPAWIPNTPDGNDSDATKGELYLQPPHVIGDLEDLSSGISTITINGNMQYTTRKSVKSHIRITTNSSLTVKDILNMFGRVTITIESGGELIIDGGVITNADISFTSGSKLTIKNGGKLVVRTNTDFNAPTGALVDITQGQILRSCDF